MAFKLIESKDEVIETLETNIANLEVENERLRNLNKDLIEQS